MGGARGDTSGLKFKSAQESYAIHERTSPDFKPQEAESDEDGEMESIDEIDDGLSHSEEPKESTLPISISDRRKDFEVEEVDL